MLSNIITVENLLFQADKLKKRILSPVSIKWMQRQQFSGSKSTGNDFVRIFLQ